MTKNIISRIPERPNKTTHNEKQYKNALQITEKRSSGSNPNPERHAGVPPRDPTKPTITKNIIEKP
jgi:hypothetical protein